MQNQENDQTYKIFRISVWEANTGLEGYGLSASGINSLVGCIDQYSETEEKFVKAAKEYAEEFRDTVTRAIEQLEDEIEYSDVPNIAKSDLERLKSMLSWEYDESYLEELAREDWQERHPEE